MIPPLAEYQKGPPDGITEGHKLVVVEKVFLVALWYIGNIWVFMEVELGQDVP